MSIALPMPGETFDTSETVIASAWESDDEGAEYCMLLTLGDSTPYYSLIRAYNDEGSWEIDWVRNFENIVPAAAEYGVETGNEPDAELGFERQIEEEGR